MLQSTRLIVTRGISCPTHDKSWFVGKPDMSGVVPTWTVTASIRTYPEFRADSARHGGL
jgi:hypothetical protein